MRCSLEVLLVIFGCAITLATARSVTQESLTRVVRSPTGDEHPGTPEAIRAKPEDTKGYVAFAKNNFQGIQGTVDTQFSKKKQEGDVIEELGHLTEKIAAEGKEKQEKLQYDSMKEAFEDCKFHSSNKCILSARFYYAFLLNERFFSGLLQSHALGTLLHDDDAGAGGASGAGASAAPAAAPPPSQPAPSGSSEEDAKPPHGPALLRMKMMIKNIYHQLIFNIFNISPPFGRLIKN
ncbi:hypothetical protein Ocin01_04908, partial [Orchesella cincta]